MVVPWWLGEGRTSQLRAKLLSVASAWQEATILCHHHAMSPHQTHMASAAGEGTGICWFNWSMLL